jgi:zinc-RING finger domain
MSSSSSGGSSEVLASELKCNACWHPTHRAGQLATDPGSPLASIPAAKSGRSFRTRCSHLFCEPCARRFFGKRLVCPVCDAPADGEAGILQLSHAHNVEIMTQVFAFAASYPEDALAVVSEAVKFNREQLALAGTREIFMRAKVADESTTRAKNAEAALAKTKVRSATAKSLLQHMTGKAFLQQKHLLFHFSFSVFALFPICSPSSKRLHRLLLLPRRS